MTYVTDHSAMDHVRARVVSLCFDAADPAAQATFWAEALGWEACDDLGEGRSEVGLMPTDSTRFDIRFLPTTAVKTTQNRVHLDLTTTSLEDQDDVVRRLLACGGRHLDIGQRPEEGHVVLADPEGNELCVLAPHNNFLAGCERLGAINCDGTRAVGLFWSAALGWPLVWDQDEETAIRAPGLAGPLITWSGPPLMPKVGRNRLHLDITGPDRRAEIDRLVALGARVVEGCDDEFAGRVVMVDPDDNEFNVV